MSENYCTTKGLGWAFLISAFFILGVPIIINLIFSQTLNLVYIIMIYILLFIVFLFIIQYYYKNNNIQGYLNYKDTNHKGVETNCPQQHANKYY